MYNYIIPVYMKKQKQNEFNHIVLPISEKGKHDFLI